MAEPMKRTETSLTADVVTLGRHYLGGRRGLIVLAVAALGAGAALNWSWLVAVGIAPVLLALAPCAVMCAAGLCLRGMMGGQSCSSGDKGSLAGVPKAKSEGFRDDGRTANAGSMTVKVDVPDDCVVEPGKDKKLLSEQ